MNETSPIANKEIKLFPYGNSFPKIHKSVFLASGVKIIGDVEIGEDSSVWYNSIVRGDVHSIRIGSMTNVQDGSVLHVTHDDFPLVIGSKVTIGHSVTLHGCTIKDSCLIGMRAVVLDGAVIEEHSFVAAGSVVKQGFVVPQGKLVAGVPAKIVRDLTSDEINELETAAKRYVGYTKLTVESLRRKNYQTDW